MLTTGHIGNQLVEVVGETVIVVDQQDSHLAHAVGFSAPLTVG